MLLYAVIVRDNDVCRQKLLSRHLSAWDASPSLGDAPNSKRKSKWLYSSKTQVQANRPCSFKTQALNWPYSSANAGPQVASLHQQMQAIKWPCFISKCKHSSGLALSKHTASQAAVFHQNTCQWALRKPTKSSESLKQDHLHQINLGHDNLCVVVRAWSSLLTVKGQTHEPMCKQRGVRTPIVRFNHA